MAACKLTGSLLTKYRPDLLEFATTNGGWATGDGHKMALALGAEAIDLHHIQVHPTGFVDGKNPAAKTKTLCAEILRGVGALLLDHNGHRFCNE